MGCPRTVAQRVPPVTIATVVTEAMLFRERLGYRSQSFKDRAATVTKTDRRGQRPTKLAEVVPIVAASVMVALTAH